MESDEAFRAIASVVLAVSGACVVMLNIGCVVVSLLNKRHGIDRHHSMIPFFTQILLGAAGFISPFIPRWLLWSVALADISLWSLLYFLVRLTFQPNDYS